MSRGEDVDVLNGSSTSGSRLVGSIGSGGFSSGRYCKHFIFPFFDSLDFLEGVLSYIFVILIGTSPSG